MEKFQSKLIVIVGPTSSGKTSLALQLAQKYQGVIISADSRQVIKSMDIGTGKIPVNSNIKTQKGDQKWIMNSMGETDIWGYDLAYPDEYFSAYDYSQFAITKINELAETQKYKFIMLVGGTGFYIDAVLGRVELAGTGPNFELREELESLELKSLQDRLMSLNNQEYEKIDSANKVRLIRAIEKIETINNQKSMAVSSEPLPKINIPVEKWLGLTAPRPLLYQRADTWLEEIWQKGLIAETKELMQKYPNCRQLDGLIYRSVVDFLTNKLTEDEAKQRAKFDLHGYIRRQQTYFKKKRSFFGSQINKDIEWFDITNKQYPKNIENLLESN